MREIKFRGYDEENKCWRYGSFYEGVMTDNPLCLGDCRIVKVIIVDGVFYHVDPESVGQFTGLRDKNGAEIYEGDTVRAQMKNNACLWGEWVGSVDFHDFEYCIETTDPSWPIASWKCVAKAEVIGNIHENPELLEA